MTLTEQWKKGELEDGFYYFRMPDGTTDIASEYKLIRYILVRDSDKIEVLAPVPSYEEYLTMKDCAKMVFEAAERETKLKDLLGKCRTMLGQFEVKNPEPRTYDVVEMLLKIDNSIGEM